MLISKKKFVKCLVNFTEWDGDKIHKMFTKLLKKKKKSVKNFTKM